MFITTFTCLHYDTGVTTNAYQLWICRLGKSLLFQGKRLKRRSGKGASICTSKNTEVNISTMNLALTFVLSLRTKSKEKLPFDNISLCLLFEIARSYIFNASALSGQDPERRNTEHRNTEGPTHRKIMIPITQVRDRIYFHTAVVSCHTDISYRTHTSFNTDISHLDIIYFHYNNTPFWHHIQSCWYHIKLIYCIWYHII